MRKIFLLMFFMVSIFADSLSFSPLVKVEYDKEKAMLGKKLFFDKRISRSGTLSCESCHNLYWDLSGTSRERPQKGMLNPISVLNAAFTYIFYSDGRKRDIYDQVVESITSRSELNSDEDQIMDVLDSIPEYRILFRKVYKDDIKFKYIVDSIVEFEKSVSSVNSRFDKYLLGDSRALNSEEKRGFELFQKIGCMACHNGKNLGSNLLQDTDFHKHANSRVINADEKSNKRLHKVPSLRNIARTAPYLYDGSIEDLRDVIRMVSHHQLQYTINKEELDSIYSFLLSLDGEVPRIINDSASN
ncbi:c-type cytochrome [Campylobacter sp. RM9344]|uniref:C-type cytochrome n=1 Tax=Campylobacter californiensis TaxID=1032243 RepID=A0AAW3ZWD1_9BACT|nr:MULTISPECIES: cytochrome c peroxidase [unclassified Campylobacter]MBE2984554.1 c-type cytochrome [Campylobacter sp. RM6883]MBE2987021.1 c-type cytochrome [Campylobacter sp. RM12919]MBE2988692.1 c-type cytochrome [Campylobacter sp. RM12920]MBE2995158.1 c-type cytochrome [Campylobacter sp. RM6913]MBE3029079.1 c-type cytochrome [Campylobacter sp. RM9344]